MFRRALSAAFSSLLLLSGCAGAGIDRQVLKLGLQDEFKTLDPAIGYDVPLWGAEHLLYNGLVGYGFDSRVTADLAERWTIADAGKRYVFTLRPGLKFHDGRPVTARDVVYSFNRLFDPATKSPGASFYNDIVGATERLNGDPAPVAGVRAEGLRTVVITLRQANSIFLQLLAMPFAAVVPDGATDLARKPIGTGPFKLKQWVSGVSITFERNPHYHDPNGPQLKGVEYQLGLNEALEALKFERGEIDMLGVNRNIPAADFAHLANDPAYASRLLKGPDAAVTYVGMNTTVKPFDDVRVRRAVAHAIDKARIVKLMNGRGTVAEGILPPTVPGFDPQLKGHAYDPNRAKALLAEAGYPQGFAVTYYCVSNDNARKIAQSLQQDLAKVGIQLTLKPLAFPTFLEAKSSKGKVGISSGNWTQDYPDPSNFLTTLYHSRNIRETNSLNDSFYRNASVDTWLSAAEREDDADTRAALFRKAEAAIVADAPAVPLYHPVKYQLKSHRLEGYQLHPVWTMDLTGVRLKDE